MRDRLDSFKRLSSNNDEVVVLIEKEPKNIRNSVNGSVEKKETQEEQQVRDSVSLLSIKGRLRNIISPYIAASSPFSLTQENKLEQKARDMTLLMESIKQLHLSMEQISMKIRTLMEKHDLALILVEKEPRHKVQTEIDALSVEINESIQRVNQEIKNLETVVFPQTRELSITFVHTQQSLFIKKLMDVLRAYQQVESIAKAKLRKELQRQYLILYPEASQEQLECVCEASFSLQQDSMLLQASNSDTAKQYSQVLARHNEIVKLERNIDALMLVFQDLQIVLNLNQSHLDTIESFMDETVRHLEMADGHMKKAVKYAQKAKRRLFCLVFLLLLVVCLFATGTLVPFFKG